MPNYIDQLDPTANENLRNAVKYLLRNYMVSSVGELFVATINLAIANGYTNAISDVSIGIDEIRAALKSGDKSYD
jgi:hypothetical protein